MPKSRIILALIGLGALYAILFGGLAYIARTDPYGLDYGVTKGVRLHRGMSASSP